MKRTYLLSFFLLLALTIVAQHPNLKDSTKTTAAKDTTVSLQEVTVRAARVVFRPDGRRYLPSLAVRNSSNNGYTLLDRLALPWVRVDVARHTIADRLNRGEVQLRINGAIASKSDVMMLDPKQVTSVDYIDNPGVRYGQGIVCVIDIHTRRSDAGDELGTDLTQALARYSDDMVYAKVNSGKSESGKRVRN